MRGKYFFKTNRTSYSHVHKITPPAFTRKLEFTPLTQIVKLGQPSSKLWNLSTRNIKKQKCEKVQNYEIVKKKNKTILTEEEKKTLMKGLPDETHYIQAAYFHMRQILGTWRRELLFNPSAQPSPITAPQIISSRVFAFSPTKTLLADFKKSWTKKGKNEKNEKEEAVREIIDCTPVTNSIPLVYSYLIPSVHGNSCEVVRIEGNTVRTSKKLLHYLSERWASLF